MSGSGIHDHAADRRPPTTSTLHLRIAVWLGMTDAVLAHSRRCVVYRRSITTRASLELHAAMDRPRQLLHDCGRSKTLGSGISCICTTARAPSNNDTEIRPISIPNCQEVRCREHMLGECQSVRKEGSIRKSGQFIFHPTKPPRSLQKRLMC